MMQNSTNWGQSVAGVVMHEGKILLVRHTYGNGKGMLVIPGGFVNIGETPQDALKREFLEETQLHVEPRGIIGVRFNMHDWYIVFRTEYISGQAASDLCENSEVVWLDPKEALIREDVPQLTKLLLQSLLRSDHDLTMHPYEGNIKDAPNSLWCF